MSNYNFKDNLTIDNTRFLKWFDNANTRKDIIGVNVTNTLLINNAGTNISINPTGNSHTFVNSGNTGLTLVDNKLGVGYNTTANTNSTLTLAKNNFISVNTAASSNDGYLGFTGAHALNSTAGSRIISYGEQHATKPGHTELYTGESGETSFYTGQDLKRVQILSNGTTNFLPNGSTTRLSITDTQSQFNHQVSINSTIQSVNATTGALIVGGGLGVLGNTVIDGTLSINSIVGNLEFNSTRASTSYSTGAITIEGGFGIQGSVNAASVTSGGGLSVAGGFALGKDAIVGGNITIESTKEATDSQTGSLVVYGGIAANKTLDMKATAPHLNLYPVVSGNESSIKFYQNNNKTGTTFTLGENVSGVGSGNFSLANDTGRLIDGLSDTSVVMISTINSTSATSGGLQLRGGLGVTKDVFVNGGVTSGTLQITGTSRFANQISIIAPGDIVGTTLANAGVLVGTTSLGIGIDTNEIFTNGNNIRIGTVSAHSIELYPNNTVAMTLSSTIVQSELPVVIDNTNTEALNVRKNADGGDVFIVDTSANKVRIGNGSPLTNTSMMSLYGTVVSTSNGPHYSATTTEDTFPTFQNLNFQHDNVALNFDMYYNGDWRSSSIGSNYQIYKFGNTLQFNYNAGRTAGTVMPLLSSFFINGTGLVTFDRGILIDQTSTEAFLVRKDSDAGDVFTVDTSSNSVSIGGTLSINVFNNTGIQSLGFTNTKLLDVVTGPTVGGHIFTSQNTTLLYTPGNTTGSTSTALLAFNTETSVHLSKQNIIESTNAEALLVRKTGDTGDVFTINTSIVTGTLKGTEATSGVSMIVNNTNTGSSAFTQYQLASDSGQCVWFLNSSTRSTEGGVNTSTIRNNVGDIRLLRSDSTGLSINSGSTSINSTLFNVEGNQVIDNTNTEAFLVRQNGDVKDIFTVDTTNSTIKVDNQLSFTNTSGNHITFNEFGLGLPSFTTRSIGTKLVLYNSLSGSAVDYSIGVNSDLFWSSVATTANKFEWYGGITKAMTLRGYGDLQLYGTTQSTSNSTGSLVVAGGVGISGNLYVGGTVYSDSDFVLYSITLDSTTPSTNFSTGSLITSGGITISNTVDATSLTNGGSLLTAGGVSVGKKLFVGNNLDILGTTNHLGAIKFDNNASGISYLEVSSSRTPSTFQSLYITGYDKTPVIAEFNSTTVSTSKSTGAFVIHRGGLGINHTTDATNLTNGGSLTVGGGAAIEKALFIGSTTHIGSSTIVPQQDFTIATEAFGANKDHGLRISTNDAPSTSNTNYRYIDLRLLSNGSSAYRGALLGTLGGGSASEYEFITLNQTGLISMNGVTTFTDTSDASSIVTGSLRVSGGTGISKQLHVGTQLTIGTGDFANDDIYLLFRGDLSWQFKQQSTGGSSRLSLQTLTDGKLFNITSSANDDRFTFHPHTSAASSYLLMNAKSIVDLTDTESLLVRKSGDTGDIFRVDTTNSRVLIGNDTSAASLARLELSGTTSSTLGPHIITRTSTDEYPLLHVVSYTHDNIQLGFDAYFDGSSWKSSDVGSNFSLSKLSDKISFYYSSGNVTGGAIGWVEGMSLASNGVISLNSTTNIEGATTIDITSTQAFRVNNNGGTTTILRADTSSNKVIVNNTLEFTDSGAPLLDFKSSSTNPPSFTSRSIGTKIVLWDQLDASNVDYALGIGSNTLWNSIPQATSTFSYIWYGGTTNVMSLRGDGLLNLEGIQIIDSTSTEAFLVRKNGDTGDIFSVDTSSNIVLVSSTGTSTSSTTGSLQVRGGVGINDNLVVKSMITNGGFDFYLGSVDQTTRGNSGISRALVKNVDTSLYINYENDFFNGTVVDSTLDVDSTSANAFVVRKNLDGGDVFKVNTSADIVTVDGKLTTEYQGDGTEFFTFKRSDNTESMGISITGTTGSSVLEIRNAANNTGRLDLSTGTVKYFSFGVNGSTTTSPLTISHTTNATSNTAGGALTISGGAAIAKDLYVGGTFYNSSDARVKTNIQELDSKDVLDKIQNLRAVTYNHNVLTVPHLSSTEMLYGMIAQDFVEPFPYLVKQNNPYDPDSFYNMDYSRTTVLLLAAVKELTNRVNQLTDRIEQNNFN